VLYQILAGATPDERDTYGLEGMTDYALLALRGCYRLPVGPFSDDSIAMADLRVTLSTLNFKAKHTRGIFSVLSAILHLGNVEFTEGDRKDTAASINNPLTVDRVAQLLGIPAEELSAILTKMTSYVRKELYTVLLGADGAAAQRHQIVRDLYAIIFA
jgi:chitin synthase